MFYEKQTWEDREVTYPMRFTKQENSDGTITLTPSPGSISNEGTNITAKRMNHIENGIGTLDIQTTGIDKRVTVLETTNKDIKVLTGTITTPDTTSNELTGRTTLDYPDGYNKTNCIVIGLMGAKKDDNTVFSTPTPISASGYILGTSGLHVTLDSNIIVKKTKADTIEPSSTTAFKFALLKIL